MTVSFVSLRNVQDFAVSASSRPCTLLNHQWPSVFHGIVSPNLLVLFSVTHGLTAVLLYYIGKIVEVSISADIIQLRSYLWMMLTLNENLIVDQSSRYRLSLNVHHGIELWVTEWAHWCENWRAFLVIEVLHDQVGIKILHFGIWILSARLPFHFLTLATSLCIRWISSILAHQK